MPIGSAFHERTLPLCESLNYRDWAGYYAVSAYETHHEHEYNAIRNAAALIDVSPLYKYIITGRDAMRLVDRLITRDATKLSVGQVIYTPWCDEQGKVIDDGTVSRLEEQRYRWTAADPSLRWFVQNAIGLDVSIEDVSETVAALAVQGPTSGALLRHVADADVSALKYFRVTAGSIGGVPVDISRTGYTGDLGYEMWMPWDRATRVWDALVAVGARFDLRPAGMLALDVARIEAGLLLIEVDFFSSTEGVNPCTAVFAVRDGTGQARSARERHVRRPVGIAQGTRARCRSSDCWPDDQVGGGGSAIREARAAAAGAGNRVSRGRACLPRWHAGRKSHVHDLVARSQEDDRAGDGREGSGWCGQPGRNGSDRRSRPASRRRNGYSDAILQSSQKNRAAGLKAGTTFVGAPPEGRYYVWIAP